MEVPYFELKTQYSRIKADIDQAIQEVFASGTFIRGEKGKAFEEAFARTIGTRNCIGVGNGTDALFLCLKALGVGPGDEVITPAFSWITSAETISQCGAIPVFADIHPEFYTLDPADVEKRITSKTKAIIVVHLYGQVADMDGLVNLSKQYNLKLIEDCAQGHLTMLQDKMAGSIGDAAAFSFYPTKNLGAYGDAGCVVTNDPVTAEFIRRYANHGALHKDDNKIEGMNSRLDELQAATLTVKLKYLAEWTHHRINHANLYFNNLQDVTGITLPRVHPDSIHSFHIFAILCEQRDALRDFLKREAIQTVIHYPAALHNLPAYHYLKHKPEDFPVSFRLQNQVLSLPVYPELTPLQIEFVCAKITEFYN